MGLIALLVLAGVAEAATQIESKGKIEEVTLFRGQAMVTRSLEVPASAKGAVTLLVPDLPEQVVGESVFANAPEGVTVRAVRFRTRAVAEEPRKEVRELDGKIQELQAELRKLGVEKTLLKHKADYLTKLEGFVAPTSKVEMTKGVLNAKTLSDLTLFIFEQREKLASGGLELDEQERKLNDEAALLKRQRGQLTARGTRTVREALLFLNKEKPGAVRIGLSYLVKRATWAPSYNVRATGDRKKISVEYYAQVQQQSGEDWDGVKLVLSTAWPTMVAQRPEISPYWVTLRSLGKGQTRAGYDFDARQWAGSNLKLSQTFIGNYEAPTQSKNEWALNKAAFRGQELELRSSSRAVREAEQAMREMTVEVSVTYRLADRTSLASRNDQQTIRIDSVTLDSKFFAVATPLISSYVYSDAEAVNTSTRTLLSGLFNAYLNGDFKGRGSLALVAPGQDVTVGFGVDGQLRTRRELVKKTEETQGGNKEVTFLYRLTVENYKDTPAKVRLMDRIPVVKNADIRITLVETDKALSTDAVYLRSYRPRGILRWDVDVPGRAVGAKAFTVEYTYKLSHDKNLVPTGLSDRATEAAAQREFKLMKQKR